MSDSGTETFFDVLSVGPDGKIGSPSVIQQITDIAKDFSSYSGSGNGYGVSKVVSDTLKNKTTLAKTRWGVQFLSGTDSSFVGIGIDAALYRIGNLVLASLLLTVDNDGAASGGSKPSEDFPTSFLPKGSTIASFTDSAGNSVARLVIPDDGTQPFFRGSSISKSGKYSLNTYWNTETDFDQDSVVSPGVDLPVVVSNNGEVVVDGQDVALRNSIYGEKGTGSQGWVQITPGSPGPDGKLPDNCKIQLHLPDPNNKSEPRGDLALALEEFSTNIWATVSQFSITSGSTGYVPIIYKDESSSTNYLVGAHNFSVIDGDLHISVTDYINNTGGEFVIKPNGSENNSSEEPIEDLISVFEGELIQ